MYGEFFESSRELDAPAHAGRLSERSSLTTPVRLTVGQQNVVGCFLAIRIAAGGYHEGQWTGRLHFSGVPAGVTIVSCQGYADGVVPVRPTSWGRLQAIYR